MLRFLRPHRRAVLATLGLNALALMACASGRPDGVVASDTITPSSVPAVSTAVPGAVQPSRPQR